jgi:small subunit ribosomal protein S3
MGQKINPIGYRLGVTKNWSSKWYANSKNFSVFLQNDIKVREFLNKKLANAAVSKIVIERPAKNAKITIYSARPGIVIGKKGEDIETLRSSLQNLMGIPVQLNIEEIRKPEVDASLIAQSIAQQLEKRVMFRRAMKRAMQNAMRLGAQGIKIMSSGRLNGIEIARSEWYREGRVPLHTLRADIDYGVARAQTTYGIIGIKVWIFKGERFEEPTNVNKDNIEQNDEIKDAPVKKTIKEAVASKIKKASEEPKTAVKAPAKAKVEAKPKAPAKAKVEAKPKAPAKAKVEAKPKAPAKAKVEAKPKAPAKAKVEKKSTKKQDKVLVEKSSNDNDKDEA